MFICGRKSFSNEDEEKKRSYKIPHSTSKKSKFIGKDSSKRNPYADRGLDKFYSVLADLDNKKKKIYSQIGVENVSFVQFVYSESSNYVRPIVVRVKNKESEEVRSSGASTEEEAFHEEKKEEVMKRNKSFYYYHFALMLVSVLLFLAIFGRSSASLCTTITWYLVPLIFGENSWKLSWSSMYMILDALFMSSLPLFIYW